MHSLDENPIQERSLFKRAARTFALIALPVAIVIVPVFWNILTKLFDVTNQCSTASAGLIWSFSALANHAILSMLLAIACTEAAAFVLLSILQVASMLSKIKHKADYLLYILVGGVNIAIGMTLYMLLILPHAQDTLHDQGILKSWIMVAVLSIAYFAAVGWIIATTVAYMYAVRTGKVDGYPEYSATTTTEQIMKLEKQRKEAQEQKAAIRTAQAAIHRIKPITLNAGQDKTISDEADQHEFLNFDWKRLFLDKLLTVIFVTRGFIFFALSGCAGVLPLIFTATTCLRPGTTTFVMQLSTFLYAAGIASVVQLLVQQFILFKAYMSMLRRREAYLTGSDVLYWDFYGKVRGESYNQVAQAISMLGISQLTFDKKLGLLHIGTCHYVQHAGQCDIQIVITWDCKRTLTMERREDLILDICDLSSKHVLLAKTRCSNDIKDAVLTAYRLADKIYQEVQAGYFLIQGYEQLSVLKPNNNAQKQVQD